MRYYRARIHMEMDVDMAYPPSDNIVRRMIRTAINALHHRKPVKARNIVITDKRDITYDT